LSNISWFNFWCCCIRCNSLLSWCWWNIPAKWAILNCMTSIQLQNNQNTIYCIEYLFLTYIFLARTGWCRWIWFRWCRTGLIRSVSTDSHFCMTFTLQRNHAIFITVDEILSLHKNSIKNRLQLFFKSSFSWLIIKKSSYFLANH
jgi:hypothetical protein